MKSQYVILINSITFFIRSFQNWEQHIQQSNTHTMHTGLYIYVFASGWQMYSKFVKRLNGRFQSDDSDFDVLLFGRKWLKRF